METIVKKQETKAVPAKGKVIPIEEQYYHLPVSMIEVSPSNYRKFYDQQALEEFAEQLKSTEVEILHPITVRPMGKKYELVYGERRFRAALLAGLTSIPAKIQDMTDIEMRKRRLAENIQRENPHPLHEALDIKELMEVEGKTTLQAAQVLGKSAAYVHNRLKLADLIEPLQELLISGKLTVSEAAELGTLAKDSQEEFLRSIVLAGKKRSIFRSVMYGISLVAINTI
ncbi:ParB/RepB/Spo0J family partition protein [Niabella sp. W65]|nr:ParB/RepB/Spo0J family partition protein [Niabella sp. W65]MCH7362772.1 ParB/RepB/Spo0J family partition protein [Niabella sp. W65]ULT38727.1 ParB/RepB/Spo0J family partition protein [Niabella sp. I65]